MRLLSIGFLFFTAFSSGVSNAQPVDDGSGFLKRLGHKAIEKRIHSKLINQITINNIIKDHTKYKVTTSTRSYGTSYYYGGGGRSFAPSRRAARRPTTSSTYYNYSSAGRPASRQASATNLREKGVDEADFVKTDGRYLYALNTIKGAGLRIYDTRFQGKKKLKQISALGFEKRMELKGLYFLPAQQRLVLIANAYSKRIRHNKSTGATSLIFIDVRNKSKPRIIRQVYMEGNSRRTHRIGNKLYIVMSAHSFRLPPQSKTIYSSKPVTLKQYDLEKQRLVNVIKSWTVKNELPHYSERGKSGAHPLVNTGNFYLNIDDINSYSMSSIVAVDLNAKKFSYQGIVYFGSTDNIYASQKALYLSSSLHNSGKYNLDKNKYPQYAQSKLIHKFSFKGSGFDYRGSGVVLGSLGWNNLNTFKFDEDKRGNLRIVTYNWNHRNKKNKSNDPGTRSPVILTALKEHPHKKQLITLSRLPNRYYPQAIGKKNEQLYGVRLFDDYAYVVTARQVDPLYVIDMRNPRSMKITGKLVIPGFSNYLHPIDNGLLLGIGRGERQSVKLSLFDIRNPNHPKEVQKIELGSQSNAYTNLSYNHHALTTLKLNKSNITRVLVPVSMSSNDYRGSLQRFEIDSKSNKIEHLGGISAAKRKSKYWYWSENNRSIIIGDRVFYYNNGIFQEAPWHSPKKLSKS